MQLKNSREVQLTHRHTDHPHFGKPMASQLPSITSSTLTAPRYIYGGVALFTLIAYF